MIISQKGERARELFLTGYTCSQSVAGAFCEDVGMPMETVMKIVLPLGGGVGGLREVCGTFTGALLILGMLYGDAVPKSPNKAPVYGMVQELAARFRAEYDTLICRDLLGLGKNGEPIPSMPAERTPEYYASRPCPNICAVMGTILEEYIAERAAEGEAK